MHWFLVLALILYGVATILIARQLNTPAEHASTNTPSSFYIAIIALIAHAIVVLNLSLDGARLNLSLPSMLILMAWMTNATFLLASTGLPIKRLGILVYPLTILSLIFAWLWPQSSQAVSAKSSLLSVHIVVSLFTYALLAIAVIQSLLYWFLEKQLKARTNPSLLAALPPLQTMEQLWLRLVVSGFMVLSLTLITGAVFSQQLFGHAFMFQHHTVLAILGWIVFATILVKRYRTGLRGAQAVIWTLLGFGLIQLGYFGTKIVSELLQVQ